MGQANQPAYSQFNTAASVNPDSKFSETLPVKLSYTMAESKRLVLAFESRVNREITWALNTLLIFSCNTAPNQGFTLDNQPYLLESLTNYMIYCIQNISSLSLREPINKRQKMVSVSVPSYIDAQANPLPVVADSARADQPFEAMNSKGKLDYRDFGMFTAEIKKREQKFADKVFREE
jgi:hypothetical protein